MQDNNRYLFIGGSTKCGTTSVFKYFEFHPAICPCKLKESRFFLDSGYKFLFNRKQRDFHDVDNFGDLFPGCAPGSVRLEATPDYLYSEYAAEKIKRELPGSRFIFILRNPVDRLLSWYRFAITMGLMDQKITFENYVNQQQDGNKEAMQHMKSKEQGRYSDYLARYIDLFGAENIHICFYEHLVENPKNFCENIARFAQLDPQYFENFDFRIYNKTVSVKSVDTHNLYRKFKRSLRPVTRLLPSAIRKRIKLAGYNLEQAYFAANTRQEAVKAEIPDHFARDLQNYYAPDAGKLATITGKKLPW